MRLFALFTLLTAAVLNGQTSVLSGERNADVGDQPAGSMPAHVFQLTNGGAVPLLIKSVQPEPGVTVKSAPLALAPGQTGDVVVQAEPLGGFGEFAYGVRLQLEPPSTEPLRLELRGRVLQYFISDPPDLQVVIPVTPGGAAAQVVTLSRLDGQPFSVLSAGWEAAAGNPAPLAGRFELQPFALRDGKWAGTLRVGALPAAGLYYARLLVQTDHPRQPRVQLNVLVKNLPPLVTFPSELHFFMPLSRTALLTAPPPVRRLRVRTLPGMPPLQPGTASSTIAWLQTVWESPQNPGESVLAVSPTRDAPEGPFKGTVTVSGAAGEGEATVSVEGVVVP